MTTYYQANREVIRTRQNKYKTLQNYTCGICGIIYKKHNRLEHLDDPFHKYKTVCFKVSLNESFYNK